MGEWLIVAFFIAGAILTIRTVGGRAITMEPVRLDGSELHDLPCPWCHAATTEGDERCPGCGRRFG